MSETGLVLRCPLSACKTVKFTAPSGGKVAGEFYVIAGLVGIVLADVDEGEEGVLIYSAPKIIVTKVAETIQVFAVGTKVYYVASSTKKATVASTGNTLIGRATEVATGLATSVEIDLHGDIVA